MPYQIKLNNPLCVQVERDGEWVDLECHESADLAKAHLAALQINVGEKAMAEKRSIVISEVTTFKGSFPAVATGDWVDTALLEMGDDDPMYVTLRIAAHPRVSENGLIYDEALVMSIRDQIRGRTGIRGHIPKGLESSAYPLGEAYWVGAEMIGNELRAKAYIPPGATREDIRRRKAIGGGLGTSIYGLAEQVAHEDGTWSAADFILQQIDFTDPESAALNMGGEFVLTAETKSKEETRPQEENTVTVITIADISDELKRQIIEESKQPQLVADAVMRAEKAEKIIKEMGDITAHIILKVPDDASLVERVTAISKAQAELQAAFGADVSVEMLVNMKKDAEAAAAAMDSMDQQAFEGDVEKEVGTYMETWNVSTDKGKAVLASMRGILKNSVLAEVSSKRDVSGKRDRVVMKETVKKLWESQFKVMAETARDSLSGGRAYVGTIGRDLNKLPSDEEIRAAREKTGI